MPGSRSASPERETIAITQSADIAHPRVPLGPSGRAPCAVAGMSSLPRYDHGHTGLRPPRSCLSRGQGRRRSRRPEGLALRSAGKRRSQWKSPGAPGAGPAPPSEFEPETPLNGALQARGLPLETDSSSLRVQLRGLGADAVEALAPDVELVAGDGDLVVAA